MRWAWMLALLPALLGAGIAALVALDRLPGPILYLRADAGTAALLLGVALSIPMLVGVAVRQRLIQQRDEQIAAVRTRAADDRRRFLRRLDHELKNPLTAIRAGLANLTDGSPAETHNEVLSTIETQVVRLSRLTADLRKLSDLETRQLELTPVDVADLLEETVAVAKEQPEADDRQLTLTLPQAPWPVPEVQGDWDLLFLAIYNLLENALKFTRPGDTVEVRAFEDGTSVAIEVADTGPGVPEDEVPHVWQELYRGESARGVAGSGLGLALVRAIVERHGGWITLRSRAGQGTVVTVRLPVR